MTRVAKPAASLLENLVIAVFGFISGGSALAVTGFNSWRIVVEPASYDPVVVACTGVLILLGPPTLALSRYVKPNAWWGARVAEAAAVVAFAVMYLLVTQDWLQVHSSSTRGAWEGAVVFVVISCIPALFVKQAVDLLGRRRQVQAEGQA